MISPSLMAISSFHSICPPKKSKNIKKLWLVISYKIPNPIHHQLHFGTVAPGTTRPAVATSPPPTHRILRELRRCGAASATTWRSSDFCDVYGMQIAAMKQYLYSCNIYIYICIYIIIYIYICMQLCIIYIKYCLNPVPKWIRSILNFLCNTGPTAPCKLDSSRCVTIPLSDCWGIWAPDSWGYPELSWQLYWLLVLLAATVSTSFCLKISQNSIPLDLLDCHHFPY